MPTRIANLPARAPEIGRLRAGWKDPDKPPNQQMQPLRNWRCTSPDETAIRAVASIYGGEVRPWAERPTEFEVFTESDSFDVLLPTDALFTAYERWGKGGNQRRCDGEKCVVPVETPDGGELKEVDCICEAQQIVPGEHKDACSVTVRLKVVLPNVPGFGIWLHTSGSIFAAMELPAQVDMIAAATGALPGTLIPCDLALDFREPPKKPWEKFQRRFSVPVLRVKESIARLQAQLETGPLGHRPAAALRQTAALPSASGAPVAPEFGGGGGTTAPSVESVVAEAAARTQAGADDAEIVDSAAEPYPTPTGGWTLEKLKEIAYNHDVPYTDNTKLSQLGKLLKERGLIA